MRGTTFIIISVSDRVEELNALLASIRADARWSQFDINILFQDPGHVAHRIHLNAHGDHVPEGTGTGPMHAWRVVDGQRNVTLHVEPDKLGCHGARVHLLRRVRYNSYVNLDDDMLLGPHTNYGPAIAKAQERGTGFVITGWARTPSLLEKKIPQMSDTFRKQIMVYNGGGMAYGEHIASLMRLLDPVKTAFDCAWPITAYVNGYTNYYYSGSLTLHRVCGTGGMQQFMKDTPLHVMAGHWLRFRPAVKQRGTCLDVLIPLDADVLPEAKILHNQRKQRFK